MTGLLSLRSISKQFGKIPVLRDVSLEIAEGEFLTILGESGSGKTTLLRIVSGFERPDQGEVWMAAQRIDTQPPNRRNVNTVFQHYALFPHLSVFENVAYGLRAHRVAPNEIGKRVDAALAQVSMGDFRDRRPSQLSGGQQQRVALARALVNRPRLLLLDEPLSALDANLRRQMQTELKALQRDIGIAFLFVTHDQEEAMTLSDRIALLRSGKLEQVSTPRDLYNCPQTEYAATFVGHTNVLQARVENGIAHVGSLCWPCTLPAGNQRFSLRPEHIFIVKGDLAANFGTVRFRASLRRQVFQGATDLIEVESDGGLTFIVRVPNEGERAPEMILEFSPAAAVPLKSSNS